MFDVVPRECVVRPGQWPKWCDKITIFVSWITLFFSVVIHSNEQIGFHLEKLYKQKMVEEDSNRWRYMLVLLNKLKNNANSSRVDKLPSIQVSE